MSISRREALEVYRIPCFIFVKLKTPCAPCDNFMQIWTELCTDPIFDRKVAFVIHNIGPDPATGGSFQPAEEYKQIIDNNGKVPLFILHLPPNANNKEHTIIDFANGPEIRTVETMKSAIINALRNNGIAI
jgi:hypothetical protein